MSKNYKAGSKFRVTSDKDNGFEIGEIVTFVSKGFDGRFEMDNGEFHQVLYGDQFEPVFEQVSSKLKPAKQALADAINQNGGRVEGGDWHKNGELPPVGEVCEAYIDYPPQWIETEIVAHKDGFAIGWCNSVMKGCHGDKAHEFRPLRTEREKAIDVMMEHCDYLGSRDFAGKLFDAGYRKEVK